MPSDDDLIGSAAAAEILHCSVRTVHRLVESGKLEQHAKLPALTGARLFQRSTVEALADQLSAAS